MYMMVRGSQESREPGKSACIMLIKLIRTDKSSDSAVIRNNREVELQVWKKTPKLALHNNSGISYIFIPSP